jgi:Retrotransposon gag protein
MANKRPKLLKDFIVTSPTSIRTSIVAPVVGANNFKLKPALINMIQQYPFNGLPNEDPNLHLSIFLEICNTLKVNGVTNDAIRLRLFPFSLAGKARAWLQSLTIGTITIWDQFAEVFLAKYFSTYNTQPSSELKSTFSNKKKGESLYDAWEIFKDLFRSCPHHGLEKWLVIHIFYNGLNYNTKLTVNAVVGGSFMNLNVEDGYTLLEDIALNHQQWNQERLALKVGIFQVDNSTLLSAQMDALIRQLAQMNSGRSATNITKSS